MQRDEAAKASYYLETLCNVKPNRRTGSSGNRAATDFFADTISSFGYTVEASPFECLDYIHGEPLLAHNGESFEVFVNPYSLGCEVRTEVVTVSTLEELESTVCEGRILLMIGAICSEQLMPKNFVFYNPSHHQRILALLENKKPAAIISATEQRPEQVGALYPYPLIVDGDFDIPGVYCNAMVGELIAGRQGERFHLKIDGHRLSSSATNIIAHLNRPASRKIVITAHIDAYEDSPGASDNASGTVVLLLLAEMLSNYPGHNCIEIAAFNGEDHYSAGGQMDYIHRYGNQFSNILLAVNIDDVGYKAGKTSYSFYGCSSELKGGIEGILRGFSGLVEGEQWFNGDHMIFVQNAVPSLALTSEKMPELMMTVTHTPLDRPELIDNQKLVEVAQALDSVIRSI